ncbi:MAG TPA: hypothetical protein VEK82_14845 [Stellaceae bacterium]|nr:hypothetical protein [Stellaceae bacterium]
MSGRHSGRVCYLDPAGAFGEIAVTGMVPVAVDGDALRRVNADAIDVVVDFSFGVLPNGTSGAVDVTRPYTKSA